MPDAILNWVRHLADDHIIGWANKGLFRRGKKLAASVTADEVAFSEDAVTAYLDGCTQVLSGPAFKELSCDCPAVSTCFHMTGMLLALRRIAEEQPKTEQAELDAAAEASPPPWLIKDADDLPRLLGKAAFRKARTWLMQSVPVEIAENDDGVTADIALKQVYTVRIPKIGSLENAVCTCKKSGCAHRALTVLTLCVKAGLFSSDAVGDDGLSPHQQQVVRMMSEWLNTLLVHGFGKVSDAIIQKGVALERLARQAEMPKMSAHVGSAHRWLADEKGRRSHESPDALRFRVARLSAHLKALQAEPLAKPFYDLAGVHTRQYHMIRDVALTGAGAEVWETEGGYAGFTLHLYAPESKKWFQLSQARPVGQIGQSWDPLSSFQKGRWTGNVAFSEIPGGLFQLIRGWSSADGRLSAREGTVMEEAAAPFNGDVPVFSNFGKLADAYLGFRSEHPFADDLFMPAVVEICKNTSDTFDPYTQIWSQYVLDVEGYMMALTLKPGKYGDRAIRFLRSYDFGKKESHRLFGIVRQEGAKLLMRPLSVYDAPKKRWRHITIEKVNER